MNHMTIALDESEGKPFAMIYVQRTGDRPLRRPNSWADVSRLAQEFKIEEKSINWTVLAIDWAEKTWGKNPRDE